MTRIDWEVVCERVEILAHAANIWRADQDLSLKWIANQLRHRQGVLIADEVGLGKTRLALAVAVCVASCGGRVAILIPPGLAYQWCDDELPPLLASLRSLKLPWLEEPSTHFLRTFSDLLSSGAYPVGRAGRLLFISHGFGLPPSGKVKDEKYFALPFVVKGLLGTTVWGGKKLASVPGMIAAGQYLKDKCPALLAKRLEEAKFGRPSPRVFENPAHSSIFESLIGELIGDFDLLVIDEAHKSRLGADVSDERAQAEGGLRSRLSTLIENILLRQGSKTRSAKRVALTATPIELDAAQWRSIFSRLAYDAAEVRRLHGIVASLATATNGLRSGSEIEVEALREAAERYQNELSPIVTRRRWRDHKTVKEYAIVTGTAGDNSHPHRAWHPHVKGLMTLGKAEREMLAVSEALAAASRGSAFELRGKTAGIRYSQALPIFGETSAKAKGARPRRAKASADPDPSTPASLAATERQAHWRRVLTAMDERLGPVASNARWSLQWHPRVAHGIEVIERLLGVDGSPKEIRSEKVLVFGEYLDSLHALQRALNIRHYFRHVAQGKALPLPANVHLDDADFNRWRLESQYGFAGLSSEEFAQRAVKWASRYERERRALRAVCAEAINEANISKISDKARNVLTTWLVQQLCAEDLLWKVDSSEGRSAAKAQVADLLKRLPDRDPQLPGTGKRTVATWAQIVEHLKADLHRDENGEYVFRMSPIAQLLVGDVELSTRRARQGTFNNPKLHPKVLLGQADVMSEGLNLHRACSHVVLFHLDWNPGRIEQQIGRIDRQDSAWMTACKAALSSGELPLPQIHVHTISMQGGYDQLRTEVVQGRMHLLRSQLFGELISPERLASLAPAAREAISAIQIDFRPGRSR